LSLLVTSASSCCDFSRNDVEIGTLNLAHDFNDAVTIRDQFRYGSYTREFRITEPGVSGIIALPGMVVSGTGPDPCIDHLHPHCHICRPAPLADPGPHSEYNGPALETHAVEG
jgi:hypothetical protein